MTESTKIGNFSNRKLPVANVGKFWLTNYYYYYYNHCQSHVPLEIIVYTFESVITTLLMKCHFMNLTAKKKEK